MQQKQYEVGRLVINAYFKKEERSHIGNLTLHLKAQEQMKEKRKKREQKNKKTKLSLKLA